MSDTALLSLLFPLGWFLCMAFGAHLGGQRNAGIAGLFLGCLFGPFGIVAAGLLDGRPHCSRCGGRQNVKPGGARYVLCEHCGTDNKIHRRRSPEAAQRCAAASFLLDEAAVALEDDPDWETSLNEAKKQLEAAGLIASKN